MQINNTSTLNSYMLNESKSKSDSILSKIAASRELSGQDNANLLISNSLSSQISGLTQSVQNANELVGMYQIADSSLQSVQASSEKLNELSVRYNSATLNSDQKASLSREFDDLSRSMQTMVNETTYNGKSLLSNEFGLDVSGIKELSIDNQAGIESFSQSLTPLFSQVSSGMNGAQVSIANNLSAITSLTSANANIAEKPMDQKVSELNAEQTKMSAATLAQAHQNSVMQQRIATLLG
jgi:flagellin